MKCLNTRGGCDREAIHLKLINPETRIPIKTPVYCSQKCYELYHGFRGAYRKYLTPIKVNIKEEDRYHTPPKEDWYIEASRIGNNALCYIWDNKMSVGHRYVCYVPTRGIYEWDGKEKGYRLNPNKLIGSTYLNKLLTEVNRKDLIKTITEEEKENIIATYCK